MPVQDYAAWLVDLDGTLYHPKPVKLAMGALLATKGFGVLPAVRYFRKQHERLREDPSLVQDNDPFGTQLELTAQHFETRPCRIDKIVRQWMVERPGPWLARFPRRELLAEIEAFHNAGGKTALVSDYPAKSKLEALGATALFDVVVCCGEPGGPPRLKPDPAGMLLAAERLGVEPTRCLVIGDRQDADGLAAERAGMGFRLVT
jgi:putative hydrolase of the HAD superfamily